MRRLVMAGLVLVMVVGPEAVLGQRTPQQGRAELEARLRNRFSTMVREQLGVDEDGRRQLTAIFQDFQDRRETLLLRENQLRRRLRTQGTLNPNLAPPPVTDEEAERLLTEMESIQEEESVLFREEKAALLEILTPGQLVRLYGMREELTQRIQALGRGGGARGARGGAGGSRVPAGTD